MNKIPDIKEIPKLYFYRCELGTGEMGYRYFKTDQNEDFISEHGLTPDLLIFPEARLDSVLDELSSRNIMGVIDSVRDENGDLTVPDEDNEAEQAEMDY